MDSGSLLKNLLLRNDQYILPRFEELSIQQLHTRIAPDANPIGWLLWHLARVQDRAVAGMQGSEQLWISDGWYERFEMNPDPEQRGNGDSREQVSAFRVPDGGILVDYYVAVRKQTDAFLGQINTDNPERLVPGYGSTQVTLAERIPGLVLEALQHGGQIAYVRGIVQGWGSQAKS